MKTGIKRLNWQSLAAALFAAGVVGLVSKYVAPAAFAFTGFLASALVCLPAFLGILAYCATEELSDLGHRHFLWGWYRALGYIATMLYIATVFTSASISAGKIDFLYRPGMWANFAIAVFLMLVFLFWPVFRARPNALTIINGKFYVPGEKYFLWLAPLFKRRVETLEESYRIALEKVYAQFKDGFFRIPKVEIIVSVPLQRVDRADLAYDFSRENFLKCVREWVESVLVEQMRIGTFGEFVFGKRRTFCRAETCIWGIISVGWDGQVKIPTD